jgi:hypothetical protein
MKPSKVFRTNLSKLACGFALLGTADMASAQTSTIVHFDYAGATVQSGGSSAYMGFSPITGSYLLTGNYSDLFGAYEAAFLGNSVIGDGVCFYPAAGGSPSVTDVEIGTTGGGTSRIFSAGSLMGDNLGYGGSPSLNSLGIGDSGYIALRLGPGGNSFYYGWAEIQRDADQTYTLLATGYNTAADQSILAGQTVSTVPEPSTLALSALGGLGWLLTFRRRK